MNIAVTIWIGLIGLSLGSFINALVWRVYQQGLPKKKQATKNADLSILRGRSMCPHCKHTLSALDLIPVISWILLKGRCRYCSKAVSKQYPIVELFTASVFILSFLFWPTDINDLYAISLFTIWLLSIVGLIALAVYDIKWMLLPNRIVFPVAILAVLSVSLRALNSSDSLSIILNAIGALLIAGGIFYVLFQLSDGKWIGGGDVKLGFALGLILGTPQLAFLMLFIASLIGIIIALPGSIRSQKKPNKLIPFGPSLIAATIICFLFGQIAVDWYIAKFLYL